MAKQRTPRTLFRLDGAISARTYTLLATATFVFIAVVWWGVAASGVVKPIFLPTPGAVALPYRALLDGGFGEAGIDRLREIRPRRDLAG